MKREEIKTKDQNSFCLRDPNKECATPGCPLLTCIRCKKSPIKPTPAQIALAEEILNTYLNGYAWQYSAKQNALYAMYEFAIRSLKLHTDPDFLKFYEKYCFIKENLQFSPSPEKQAEVEDIINKTTNPQSIKRSILSTIERMSHSLIARKGCTFGDTDYSSDAVVYGYDLAINEVLGFLEKNISEYSKKEIKNINNELIEMQSLKKIINGSGLSEYFPKKDIPYNNKVMHAIGVLLFQVETYRKRNDRLFEGRNYLMGVEPKELTVESALEAFGFSKNGLNIDI